MPSDALPGAWTTSSSIAKPWRTRHVTYSAYGATAFGVFQLSGVNHRRVGFETVGEYARFVSRSEANQVEVWARFLETQGMLEPLRKHDWATFARRYLGPTAVKRYAPRLADAYQVAVAEFQQGRVG